MNPSREEGIHIVLLRRYVRHRIEYVAGIPVCMEISFEILALTSLLTLTEIAPGEKPGAK
jgi:hypothetical protein